MTALAGWAPHARWIILALTGAIGVVGTLKTLTSAVSGIELSPQQFAFYLGGASIAVYFAAGVGAIGFTLGYWIVNGARALGGGSESSDSVAVGTGAVVGGVAALFMLITLLDAGVIFDYNGADAIGRAFSALVGVVVVGGGLWYFWKGRPAATEAAPRE